VVGAAAAAVLGAWAIDTSEAPHCDRGQLEIAEVWDPDVRRDIEARGTASSSPQLLTRLDTWSAAWAEAYDRACRATRIDHVQSEALLDRRIACLQRRRRELSTLVALLRDDEPTLRGHEAIEAIDVAACADTERLLRSGTIAPAMAQAVDPARDRVERARVHREAGHYAEALALAREGQAAADATNHPATRAEAWVELGLSLAATGERADAVDPLAHAVAIASAAGEDDLAAEAWLGLVGVKSLDSSTTELFHWESFADAAVLRVGDPPRMRVRWLLAVGAVTLRAGRLDEALGLLEKAHEHVRPLADEEPLRLADVLARLAQVQLLRGEPHEAEGLIEESLALRQDVLGDHHPRVADAMQNYGGVLLEVGRFEAASRVLSQALDIAQESLGPEHPSLIGILAALGSAERRLGHTERAREHLLAVLRLREVGLGPHHVDVAATLVGLANVDYAAERYLAARDGLLRALAIYGRSLAPDHPDVLDARASLANVWTDLGDHGRAEAEYRAILSAREATLGTAHPKVAMTRANLGQLLVTAGRPAEGLELLEQALESARASMGAEHPFVAFAESAQRDARTAIAAAAGERER
jgi:eukaryotic-like serine/threonine-protein kinase